jgi:formylglycine-generating enzyme required for sulfatase activity
LSGLSKVTAEKNLATLGPVAAGRDRLSLDLGRGVRMDLVTLKPGSFTMGGVEAPQAVWQVDERPEHRVTLSRSCQLGKTEVTRAQFAAFVKAAGYTTDAEREGTSWGRLASGDWAAVPGLNWQSPGFQQADDHPVVCVSWNDAKAFCDWATKKSGRTVRLPTEAEWEYACRAGTKATWSYGEDEGVAADYGWIDRNSGGQPHAVGQKKPNPAGFFDMHGNVWEWCVDFYNENYYRNSPEIDPAGPAAGKARVLRGGSWLNPPADCRSANRGRLVPNYRGANVGFRIAMEADGA